jgi:hypothetical protein
MFIFISLFLVSNVHFSLAATPDLCTKALIDRIDKPLHLMKPLSAADRTKLIFIKLNKELNHVSSEQPLVDRLLTFFNGLERSQKLTEKQKNLIDNLLRVGDYRDFSSQDMARLRQFLTGSAVGTSDPLKLLSVQLTFANDGGLLNTAATWMGSNEEFRDIIVSLAGKNEVLANISEEGSSMARFIDINVIGSKKNMTQFLNAYYEKFYGGYGLASEKQRFIDKVLSARK